MILPMARLRIMGPRERLDAVLKSLQESGVVHLAATTADAKIPRLVLSEREARRARHLRRLSRDVDALGIAAEPARPTKEPSSGAEEFARWARAAARARRALERLDVRARDLEAQRAELARFEQFLGAFRGLLPRNGSRMHSYHLILRG
jgi:vacuolar-type H+-ATPase subunit I/STV1